MNPKWNNFFSHFLMIIIFLNLISCSHRPVGIAEENSNSKNIDESENNASSAKIYQKGNYALEDASGTFWFEKVLKTKGNKVISLNRITDGSNSGKVLEQSIAVMEVGTKTSNQKSKPNQLDHRIQVRPSLGQFQIYFDNKKYFSQIKINAQKNLAEVDTTGPNESDNKQEKINLPANPVICFFSQVVECLRIASIVKKARLAPNQEFSFTLLWDSYPFHQNQYPSLDGNIFVNAKFKYETKVNNYFRYQLKINNDEIIYHLTPNDKLQDMFWVSQGLSITGQSGIY
jgi:hypothetical protein